ncbi:methyl-coenzyme M reductase operon protein D [Methanocaldococcus fervens]|nr:methyl-coenzyme M reductase operon protein D [Methanocaldococcus fervens]
MSEEIKVVDIKIFPHRYLKAETTEKVLNEIYDVDGIVRVIVHGQPLPKTVPFGPARGLPVNHQDRKIIKVKGEDMELRVKVGEIVITADGEKFEEIMDKIEEICERNFPYGYDIYVGAFTKIKPTVTDYMKYGDVSNIDPRLIGMVDASARLKDSVKMIK